MDQIKRKKSLPTMMPVTNTFTITECEGEFAMFSILGLGGLLA